MCYCDETDKDSHWIHLAEPKTETFSLGLLQRPDEWGTHLNKNTNISQCTSCVPACSDIVPILYSIEHVIKPSVFRLEDVELLHSDENQLFAIWNESVFYCAATLKVNDY